MAFRLFPYAEVAPGAKVEIADGLVVTYDDSHMVKGVGSSDTSIIGVQFAATMLGALGVNLLSAWLIDKLAGSDVSEVDVEGKSAPLTRSDLERFIGQALEATQQSPAGPKPPSSRRRQVRDGGATAPGSLAPPRKRKKRRGRH